MSEVKFRHHVKWEEDEKMEFDLGEIQKEVVDLDGLERVLQEDADTFLMNHLLMSVQFFENYERDIKLLRENWFKDFSLHSHHKKCFFADGLLSLSRGNVKFSPLGANKNFASQLLPLRVYISSDNVEAAFNPSVLGQNKLAVWPQYQLTVRTNSKTQKSGCITLVEFKTLDGPHNRSEEILESIPPITKQPPIYALSDSNFDKQYEGRYTRNKSSSNFGKNYTIPINCFYIFEDHESRMKPKPIEDFKMNSAPATSHEIPPGCFQYEEVRNDLHSRRDTINKSFRRQKVLNSAAFKGYFCDLLIERLSESFNLNIDALNGSTIEEEFIVVNQKGVQYSITPVITIRDWNKFIPIRRFAKNNRGKLLWPTNHMQDLLKAFPCSAVPTSHFRHSKECVDYEKIWKIVFPKQEEFLLLHMMHAHIRCYLFALLIYKSCIEAEINSASLGPKHLLHLLFWKVHKNFLAWPDDRPAETLLIFLKALYKKLQNKFLPDFFMPSRNLLASSHPKDLHKAQSLIKKIAENPVPYMIRAFSQLIFEHSFYPTFDCQKLYDVLTDNKVNLKEKKKKVVQFQNYNELIKNDKLFLPGQTSLQSETKNEILTFNSDDYAKCNEILLMFILHFIRMGTNSVELDCLPQALFYLHQTQKLLQLMTMRGANQNDVKDARQQIRRLKQDCYRKVGQELEKSSKKEFLTVEKPEKKFQKREEQVPKQELSNQDDKILNSEEIATKL